MKFGVNTLIWSGEFDRSFFRLLPGIKAAGFDGIEVPIFHPERFPSADVRRAVADNGLECNACSVFLPGASLIDAEPAARLRAMDHLKLSIDTAAEAGVSILAGPLYSRWAILPGRRRTAGERARARSKHIARSLPRSLRPAWFWRSSLSTGSKPFSKHRV